MKEEVMRSIVCILLIFLSTNALAQQAVTNALEKDNKTLNRRFEIIVTNSQNFTDYKVIKESYLRNFWSIVKDSVIEARNSLRAANDSITRLNGKIVQQRENLERIEIEKAEMEHDSTHINAYGMDMHKGFFLTLFLAVVVGLTFLLVTLYGRLSLLQRSYSETSSTLNETIKEFDEYRRKSLDKQMKLSRELQNERNKIEELEHRK